MGSTARVLVGLAAGLSIGIVLGTLQHPWLPSVVAMVEPIGVLWLNALRMTVVPLVFALLVSGVASASAAAASGRLALRALALFVALLGAGALYSALTAPTILALLPTAPPRLDMLQVDTAAIATQAPALAEWIVGIVPANPIAAAADGAMLPLVVFALLFGFALTRIAPERQQAVLALAQAVIDTVMVIVRWVLWVAPLGVFALVLPIGAGAGIDVLGALVVYVLLVCALLASVVLAMYPLAGVFGRLAIADFARAVAPAQAVAFSTQSSLASLPAMLQGARTHLRLPKQLTDLVLPLAVSVFRITGPVAYLAAAAFVAWLYGIALTPAQLAAGVAVGVVVGMGAVGLPGHVSFMATYVPVFQAMGLPLEPLALLLAVNAFPDIFMTVGNVTADVAATSIVAAGGPDHDIATACADEQRATLTAADTTATNAAARVTDAAG